MKKQFKIGDIVRCIDAVNSDNLLVSGHIYTISEIEKSGLFGRLKGVPFPMGAGWWSMDRFELVYGPSTLLNKVLNKAGTGLIENPWAPDEDIEWEPKVVIDIPQKMWDKIQEDPISEYGEWLKPSEFPCKNHRLFIYKVMELEHGAGAIHFTCPNCEDGVTIVADIVGIKFPAYVEMVTKDGVVKPKEEEEPTLRLIRI